MRDFFERPEEWNCWIRCEISFRFDASASLTSYPWTSLQTSALVLPSLGSFPSGLPMAGLLAL